MTKAPFFAHLKQEMRSHQKQPPSSRQVEKAPLKLTSPPFCERGPRLSVFEMCLSFLFTFLLASSSYGQDESGCVSTWPEDRARPAFKEHFPLRGTSGHVSVLEVTVTHLPGETVFPGGIALLSSSDESDWLKAAEFRFPHASSEVKPHIERSAAQKGKNQASTKVRIPLIPLPSEAGRKELTLPRLPVSVSRASGQVHTICTDPHVITVEDPLASSPQAEAKPDPPPRPQIEVWETLRDVVLALLIALPIAALLVWAFFRFRKNFKRATPPPPPRPPWELAFARLDAIDGKRLLEKEEYEQYLDEVSDALREYLGDRYGFDGLESTTRETLRQLVVLAPDFDDERAVRTILQRADLVKFARRPPVEEECREAMSETRRMVQRTVLAPAVDARPTATNPNKKGGARG